MKSIKIGSYIFLFIAVFFLPLNISISNIGIIGLLFTHFIYFLVNGLYLDLELIKRFFYFSPFILILPVIIGCIYSPLHKEAINELTKYIFLLASPFIIFRKDLVYSNLIKILKISLITGCLVNGIFLLSANTYNFMLQELPLTKLFSSHFTGFNFLSNWGNLHPIYQGSYYLMALSLFLFSKLNVRLFLKVISSLILITTIVFINSRIIIFSLTIIVLLFGLLKLNLKLFFLGSTIILIGFILIFPYFKKTYIYNKAINGTVWELKNNIGTHNTDTKTTSDSRMSRWLVGLDVFKEKPFFGHGSGTENEILLVQFKKNKMKLSADRSYNSHNQILGFLIRFGLIGGASICLFIIVNWYLAISEKDLIYVSFLIIISSIFCVENYLDRNMGINFIALFGSVFLINRND